MPIANGPSGVSIGNWKLTIENATTSTSDVGIYILSVLLGISAGVVDVWAGDLLLTALFVLVSTMLLGVLRPSRPWRWILIVGTCVPLVQVAAYLLLTEKPTPSEIYQSFLGLLTGCAGAYGGSVLRRMAVEIFGAK